MSMQTGKQREQHPTVQHPTVPHPTVQPPIVQPPIVATFKYSVNSRHEALVLQKARACSGLC